MVIMAHEQTPSPQHPDMNGESPERQTLTVRMIMQGKVIHSPLFIYDEVGSIIGKKGDNVKKYREESGAKINISDSSCPERIVTVTGTTDGIYKAFTMICKKFEEDIIRLQELSLQAAGQPPGQAPPAKPPVTVRLIVPASQCGSLIGKGGTKIKEIREVTGALIQVASEMLPNSTERTVTVSGSADSITQCIYHICCVMLESPPKGATIPYRPKPAVAPVLIAGGQAYAMPAGAQYAIQQPDVNIYDPRTQPHAHMYQPAYPGSPQQIQNMQKMAALQGQMMQPGAIPYIQTQQGLIPAGIPHPGVMAGHFQRAPAPVAPNSPQAHEMTIPNDLIGCIIGRGGSKINEIRQLSGANIKIANVEEGSMDRKVTIMGTPETISAAQYLINASIEMHKALLLEANQKTLLLEANPTLNPAAPGQHPFPISQIVKAPLAVPGHPPPSSTVSQANMVQVSPAQVSQAQAQATMTQVNMQATMVAASMTNAAAMPAMPAMQYATAAMPPMAAMPQMMGFSMASLGVSPVGAVPGYHPGLMSAGHTAAAYTQQADVGVTPVGVGANPQTSRAHKLTVQAAATHTTNMPTSPGAAGNGTAPKLVLADGSLSSHVARERQRFAPY